MILLSYDLNFFSNGFFSRLNLNKIKMSTDNLINGVYFIQIQTAKKTITKKVQIIR